MTVGNGCPCGGGIATLRHEVTSDKGATKWAGRPVSGPATVERHVCAACGRQRIELYHGRTLIASRG